MSIYRCIGAGMSKVSSHLIQLYITYVLTQYRYFTVLRLALPRASIKDVTYEGVVIPKGTVYFINAFACNRGKLDPWQTGKYQC